MKDIYTYFGKQLVDPKVKNEDKALIVVILNGIVEGNLAYTWDKDNEPLIQKVDAPISYEIN